MITLLLKLQSVNSNACKNDLPEFLRKVDVCILLIQEKIEGEERAFPMDAIFHR